MKDPFPKLLLHEAIGVVLLLKAHRVATCEEIAAEINDRKLFKRRDGKPLPPYQVMMRAKLSGGKYAHLFLFEPPNRVHLRNLIKS
ncbi:MAG TPA: hypothetical protein VG737_11080 [Cyclobacteriaceae bacterium]|nr:hypothetical protein [Cyclobacteriaceae bacterium]